MAATNSPSGVTVRNLTKKCHERLHGHERFSGFQWAGFFDDLLLARVEDMGLVAFLDIVFVWRVLNADLLVDLEVLGQPREF
jgi:hypothetical protein